MTILIKNKRIYTTFSREGIHCFPEALTDPQYKTNDDMDVSFLGYPHRHIFHFYVEIDVQHDNRDIELIQFKRWLESIYNNSTLFLDNKSCEMIADDLALIIHDKFPTKSFMIKISEDLEHGICKEYQVENSFIK
jgi:hypothetical protein